MSCFYRLGAEVHIAGAKKSHTVSVRDLILGPFQSSLRLGFEVITSLIIPAPASLSYCAAYKFNPRRQLSRSTVGGAMICRVCEFVFKSVF